MEDMRRVQTALWLAMMAGATGLTTTAMAQTPDAPTPQQPASQQPASQAPASQPPAKQNPNNQGGCYIPDASGKQVFVPNCGLDEAPKRKSQQGDRPVTHRISSQAIPPPAPLRRK